MDSKTKAVYFSGGRPIRVISITKKSFPSSFENRPDEQDSLEIILDGRNLRDTNEVYDYFHRLDFEGTYYGLRDLKIEQQAKLTSSYNYRHRYVDKWEKQWRQNYNAFFPQYDSYPCVQVNLVRFGDSAKSTLNLVVDHYKKQKKIRQKAKPQSSWV